MYDSVISWNANLISVAECADEIGHRVCILIMLAEERLPGISDINRSILGLRRRAIGKVLTRQ